MTLDIRLLIYSAILSWIMIMFSALVRGKLWTPSGFLYATGNRDQGMAVGPMPERAERASKNMLENLLLFGLLLLAARAGGVPSEKLILPAQIFFYARLAYFPVYVIGIPFLRTAIWAVSVAGMGMIAFAGL